MENNDELVAPVTAAPVCACARWEQGKWPWILAAIVPVGLLALFVHKAFHIDDTVFIWIARQIQKNPLDFFGFSSNWTGQIIPISQINQNPPGVSFFIALVCSLFGESEVVLHTAFLLPALALGLGACALAKRFGVRPALATLCAVLTPAYLVSSTNVMCDTLMMAFYVWSVLLWIRGLDRRKISLLLVSGFLAGLATLTKYFAVSLIPLLAAYTLFVVFLPKFRTEPDTRQEGLPTRKGLWFIFALVLPLIMIIAYQWYTGHLYGIALLSQASSFAMNEWRGHGWFWSRCVIGLGFAGGCIAFTVLFAPFLWSYRVILGAVAVAAAMVIISNYSYFASGAKLGLNWWLLAFQWSLWIAGGLLILWLPLPALWRDRDATAFLLFAWIWGTFLFAAFVNWTTAARNILPMTIPVGILLARQVDLKLGHRPRWIWAVLGLAAVLSLSLARADYLLANSARDAAQVVTGRLKGGPGKIYFSGHWGFQYYMEQNGAIPLPYFENVVANGDYLVLPSNNVVMTPNTNSPAVHEIINLKLPVCRWLSTMQQHQGAGFYSSTIGAVPFIFGAIQDEEYRIFQIQMEPEKEPPSVSQPPAPATNP